MVHRITVIPVRRRFNVRICFWEKFNRKRVILHFGFVTKCICSEETNQDTILTLQTCHHFIAFIITVCWKMQTSQWLFNCLQIECDCKMYNLVVLNYEVTSNINKSWRFWLLSISTPTLPLFLLVLWFVTGTGWSLTHRFGTLRACA